MSGDRKIRKYSERILKLFHENARNTLHQSEIRKAFSGIDWFIHKGEVIDDLVNKKRFLSVDNNLFRFYLTECGNKFLDTEYGTKENHANKMTVAVMTLFADDKQPVLNQKEIKKYFTDIEWKGYHKIVLEYLIERMGWVIAENNSYELSLTIEGKKFLDNLKK